MTSTPTNDTTERRGLWVTDAELIRRSGVPEKIMREALKAFDADRNSGFPQKKKLYGDRRYWPAVQEYWKATNPIPQVRKSA